jgi:hypothetical protein
VTAAFYSDPGLWFAGQTISFGPATPTHTSDCARGGYKNFVDTHGRPFRSRLRCIAFVFSRAHGRH